MFQPQGHAHPARQLSRRDPPSVRGGERLIDPILGYPHEANTEGGSGTGVIGGDVYRGKAISGLAGRYVFGSLQPNGRLYVGLPPGDPEGTDRWQLETVSLDETAAGPLEQLLAFGRDGAGELYALGGRGVYRVVPAA